MISGVPLSPLKKTPYSPETGGKCVHKYLFSILMVEQGSSEPRLSLPRDVTGRRDRSMVGPLCESRK